MPDVIKAQTLIQELFPVAQYGNQESAWWAAYRKLKLQTLRRARAIWRGEAKIIKASEMDALRHAKSIQQESETILHLQSTAAFLSNVDPEFYGPTIDQLRDVASGLGIRGEEQDQ